MEENEKGKGRSVALKTTNCDEDNDASSTDEDMKLLVKKFSKFLKKKGQRKF